MKYSSHRSGRKSVHSISLFIRTSTYYVRDYTRDLPLLDAGNHQNHDSSL